MTGPLYEDQFDSRHDFSHNKRATKTLIIASTVRSGSHMLGHALHASGAFGYPLEYAQEKNLTEWKKRLEVRETNQAMETLLTTRASENGVFGIKVHYRHLPVLGGLEGILNTFPDPHFVLLTRDDVMAQAVSLAIAKQTGNWISGQNEGESEPEYCFDDIDESLRRVVFANASWQYLLAANGVPTLPMRFSEVRDNMPRAIADIAAFMDVELNPDRIPESPVTHKQSQSINQSWVTRFQQEASMKDELLRYHSEHLTHRLKRKFR